MSALMLISFRRTDYSLSENLVDVIMEIADHFKMRKEYVPDFCTVISGSRKWTIENLEKRLEQRLERFGAVSSRKIVDLTRKAFLLCKTDDDIHQLRGALLESLVIGANGGSEKLKENNFGWGAKVYIHRDGKNHEIRYECNEPKDKQCKKRSTVDYGVWNGKSGKFYECKVQPRGIGYKEIMYMETLAKEMSENNISYELFLVSAESQEAIKERLLELNITKPFHLLGAKELQLMAPA